MDNHNILFPALQKYYSALKSLYDFGQYGDFFDDVSNLDKFFSEFRNVTFVVQKGVGTEENKAESGCRITVGFWKYRPGNNTM